MTEDLASHCLRCGLRIEDDLGPGVGGLCWPPGSPDYYVRHLFSKKWARRKEKRDAAKLAAWKDAAEQRR